MITSIPSTTPYQALQRFRAELGLNDQEIAAAFGVTPRTIERWLRGDAYPQHQARRTMALMLEFSDALGDTFSTVSAGKKWLRTESRYLGGLTPVDAIRVGRVDRARAALEALESGIFV
jgi:transcriptional regulator with XRE-family HTH domain